MKHVIALILATTLALAGCVMPGSDDDPLTPSQGPVGEDGVTAFEDVTREFEGALVGGIGTPAVAFKALSTPFEDVRAPAAFADGRITLEWDESATVGPLRLALYSGDEVIHEETSDASPIVLELTEDDARVDGMTGFNVWPGPATVVGQAEWSAAFHFRVPVDTDGDGESQSGSSPS